MILYAQVPGVTFRSTNAVMLVLCKTYGKPATHPGEGKGNGLPCWSQKPEMPRSRRCPRAVDLRRRRLLANHIS